MNASQGLFLLGVGGGGCHYAAATRRLYGDSLRALGLDTDQHAIGSLDGLRGILLGGPRLDGLGSGGDLVKGRMAMQDSTETVQRELEGVRMAVVVTTLGGGTGGGATPELLRSLRKMEITTLCFAMMPFSFEPAVCHNLAERALPQIDENADTVVVIRQDDLWRQAEAASLALPTAQQQACAIFASGATLIWQLLLMPGFIRFDPARLQALISSRGRARLYIGEATGAERAATATALLAGQIEKHGATAPARAMMLGIVAGSDLRLAEIDTIMRGTTAALPSKCRLDMGTVLHERHTGKVALVALVFETWNETPAGGGTAMASTPAPAKSGRGRGGSRDAKLGYSTGRGRFRDIEPTIFNGEDLDIPTYIRKHIAL